MKREIYKNGPIIAVIPIYRDFLVYKERIYKSNDVNIYLYRNHKNSLENTQLK